MHTFHVLTALGQKHEIAVPKEVGFAEPSAAADWVDVWSYHAAELFLVVDVEHSVATGFEVELASDALLRHFVDVLRAIQLILHPDELFRIWVA